jgi:spermidine synthase
MVLELIAARMLAPYIGVSLYTWTSIIGVILAGIALGNYLGGKVANRFASPMVLAIIFFAGSLATVAILPTIQAMSGVWFNNMPMMLNFVIKVLCVFFLPAIILSMVSPIVIKLTLTDLGQTGGVVGTIYAFSTAGAILGTFMTGFYFILWFGTRMIVWLIAGILILTGILAWFSWKVPARWHLSSRNLILWITTIGVIIASVILFQFRGLWQENYLRESNYYTIRVWDSGNTKVMVLDHIIHSAVTPDDPTVLEYDYAKMIAETLGYVTTVNRTPSVLILGGGGYSLPRYIEATYPGSINDVVEIDPAVTEVAYDVMGLPRDTSIKTYNQDARLFLMQRNTEDKYNIVIGDVFNDSSTPYHLTTLEFDKLVKANMQKDGIYLVHIVDDYSSGRYMPSFINTLKQAFDYVYLFGTLEDVVFEQWSGFIIAATDRQIDVTKYREFVTDYAQKAGYNYPVGFAVSEVELRKYLEERKPLLLTDDYAPTDILIAPELLQ